MFPITPAWFFMSCAALLSTHLVSVSVTALRSDRFGVYLTYGVKKYLMSDTLHLSLVTEIEVKHHDLRSSLDDSARMKGWEDSRIY